MPAPTQMGKVLALIQSMRASRGQPSALSGPVPCDTYEAVPTNFRLESGFQRDPQATMAPDGMVCVRYMQTDTLYGEWLGT